MRTDFQHTLEEELGFVLVCVNVTTKRLIKNHQYNIVAVEMNSCISGLFTQKTAFHSHTLPYFIVHYLHAGHSRYIF